MAEEAQKIKVVFVGDSKCGKTHLITTYLRGVPSAEHKPTLFENYFKEVTFRQMRYKLFICDTGGHGDFYRLKKMSYLNTDIFVLCVSYGEREGLKNSEKWLEDLKKTKAPIFLCMTRADQTKNISSEDVQKFSNKHGMDGIFECSVNDRKSLKRLFEGIIRVCVEGSVGKTGCYGCSCPCC